MRKIKLLLSSAFLLIIGLSSIDAQDMAQMLTEQIHYRDIGPTRQSGRFVDFAVVAESPKVYYAATASGGLWKTINNGISFTPIFDDQNVISIGDVTVAPSDSSVAWVGSGEANNSRSSYWGDGVYKSTDGGKTWANKGLKETHHIGRILIHPTNPNILYVAALGHLYSDNPERGVFKSTNGGDTWTKVLGVKAKGKDIGVVDIVMHPSQPETLFAATFDKIRQPWTYNPGGPGSAIYKSTDSGSNWTKVEGGLPTGFLGRIGLDIAASDPNIIYANIENVNVEGLSTKKRLKQLRDGLPSAKGEKVVGDEMWRSSDGGASWKKVSPDGKDVGGGPAYYYQQVRIDPNDPDHVYVLGVRVWETKDGGETWGRPFNFGGDNHALWIDPADSKHMILGYDHGMGTTYDGGKNWIHPDDQPLAQFYAISVDMESPYNIYGGLQDNGSVKGPSTKKDGSHIKLEDWSRVGGGDGMYNVVDPDDSRWLYNESQFGPIARLDQVTGERTSIKYKGKMRWNWCAPILISPHDSKTIYHAGNKIVKSTNRGGSWKEISPDLTTADSAKIIGTGNIQYSTITSIDESPLMPGLLWAGTDDGNLQMTKDGGKNWTLLNDRIPNNPKYWVTRVVASPNKAGRAYVTYSGLRRDDFSAFIYKTEDFGESWASIVSDLPAESINVVREDRVNPELLFVGTDKGVYTSLNGGESWMSLRGNMPNNPVHDLLVHPRENDLVVATHGRGIFIANIQHLQEATSATTSKAIHVYDVRPKTQWNSSGSGNSAYNNHEGESESLGLEMYFHSKTAQDTAVLEIRQGDLLLNEIKTPVKAGLNKLVWDYQKRKKERNEKELKQANSRIERFKDWVSPARLQSMIANVKYEMSKAGPGSYQMILKIAGQSIEKEGIVLRE